METWIIADHEALKRLYKNNCLKLSSLPQTALEQRNRHDIQDALVLATKSCTNAYAKNKLSFEALANINPEELKKHLPSFARMIRILKEQL